MRVPMDHRLRAPKAPTAPMELTVSSMKCLPKVPAAEPARVSMAFGERPATR